MNDTTFQGDGKIAFVPVVVNAKQPKQTNADRIRGMTDEELAGYLAPCACPPIWFNEDTDCPVNKEPRENECLQCWLDYLKQEAT